jgi:hypothetical protein
MLSQELQQLHSCSQAQGSGGGEQAEEGKWELLSPFLETGHLQSAELSTASLSFLHLDF